jgi:DNA-binding HxlR family transcriptional regulator
MKKLKPENPIQSTVRILGGRWKPMILWHLQRSTLRFGELRKAIPEASQKMLTQQLRELERDGIIHREVYPQVPPKVEYSLTTYGKTALPIMKSLSIWGKKHQKTSTTFPEELKFICTNC